jgi:hypothetical protein
MKLAICKETRDLYPQKKKKTRDLGASHVFNFYFEMALMCSMEIYTWFLFAILIL